MQLEVVFGLKVCARLEQEMLSLWEEDRQREKENKTDISTLEQGNPSCYKYLSYSLFLNHSSSVPSILPPTLGSYHQQNPGKLGNKKTLSAEKGACGESCYVQPRS